MKNILTLKKIFKKDFLFKLPILFVIGVITFPIIIFLFQFYKLRLPNDFEFLNIIGWTFFQASSSVIITIFLALFGSKGLLTLYGRKYYFLAEGLLILPSLLPPIILVISVMNWVQLFISFPFGLGALIACQVLTYTGLCSVIFTRVLAQESSALSEWAYLHNISSFQFLKVITKSVLKKDLLTLSALVFVGAFTSLSLPLLTAGGQAISLEFFIYEQLKNPEQWQVACSLMLFQSLLIFFIYYKSFGLNLSSSINFHQGKIYLLKNKFFIFIPFICLLLSVGGLFLISNLSQPIEKLMTLKTEIIESIISTLFLGLGSGFLIFIFLNLISLSFHSTSLRKFVTFYNIPSITLLGWAFLMIPFYGQSFILLKWIVGLSILNFSLVYRLRGEITLEKLTNQVEAARLMGASWPFVFWHILWPQTRKDYLFCAGVAGFLACGDFAYSLIVSQSHLNLGLLTYDLFSSYRLDMAVLISWLLLLLSFLILIFWMGIGFVFTNIKKYELN